MHSAVIFREVKKEDNVLLAKMIRQVFKEHDAPQSGTVFSDPTTDDLFGLFRKSRSVLWVAESERGKGTGRQLMELCIASARKLGFRKLSSPLGNSGHTTCNIWMLLEL